MAITKRIWMKPPIVYELTIPSSQRTSSMTKMVQSMTFPFPVVAQQFSRQALSSREHTQYGLRRAVKSPWVMKTRYFYCWLVGAWMAGSLFMIMVATQNFRSVDRLLAAPGRAGAQVETMGHDAARAFLRYQVSEQNRWYFETWEKIQLALGVAALAATFRQRKLIVSLTTLMSAPLLLERFYLTPEIIRLGRLIDFVPQAAPSPERVTFWTFHAAYSGVEIVKLALGLLLSGRLIFDRNRVAGQVDVVDEPDHSHVNR